MGGDGSEGTNPEQLFALGYAACFANAMRSSARRDGDESVVEGAEVTAKVDIGAIGQGRFGARGHARRERARARAGGGRGARGQGARALPVLQRHPRQHRRRAERHRQLRIAAARALDVGGRRRPAGHADPHRRAAAPDGAAGPARAVGLHARDRVRLARDQHLVEHDVVEDLGAAVAQQPRRSARRARSCGRSGRRARGGRAGAARRRSRTRAPGARPPACTRSCRGGRSRSGRRRTRPSRAGARRGRRRSRARCRTGR